MASCLYGAIFLNKKRCSSKIMLIYVWASLIFDVAGFILAKNGIHNIWIGHLWILATLIIFGQWSMLRVKQKARAKPFWAMSIFGWFVLAFTMGIAEYYPYIHVGMAALGLAAMLCSKHYGLTEKSFSIAFACEMMLCGISMHWHGLIPCFWAARNLAWAFAFACVTKIT